MQFVQKGRFQKYYDLQYLEILIQLCVIRVKLYFIDFGIALVCAQATYSQVRLLIVI